MTYVVTGCAAIVGGLIAERLRVPAGALLGAMVGVAIANLSAGEVAARLPDALKFLTFVALGWLIGQDVTRDTVGQVRSAPAAIVLPVLGLVLVGGLVAWLLVLAGWFDPVTAYLAASPGGLSQMTALGLAMDANVPVVVTIHVARVLTVVMTAPIVVRLLDP